MKIQYLKAVVFGVSESLSCFLNQIFWWSLEKDLKEFTNFGKFFALLIKF